MLGVKTTPPAAPGIVSKNPVPRSLKVFLTIAKSSLIEDFAEPYRAAKKSMGSDHVDDPTSIVSCRLIVHFDALSRNSLLFQFNVFFPR